MKKITFAALVIVLAPLIGSAHPGHGNTDGYSIIHYFVEPVHAVITYSILLFAVIYIWYSRRQKQRN
jgi:hypothetical protein